MPFLSIASSLMLIFHFFLLLFVNFLQGICEVVSVILDAVQSKHSVILWFGKKWEDQHHFISPFRGEATKCEHEARMQDDSRELIPENKLGVFRLSRTRFTRNYDGLAHFENFHVPVGFVSLTRLKIKSKQLTFKHNNE